MIPKIKVEIYHTAGCWTRGPCAVCGTTVTDTPAPWGGGGILAQALSEDSRYVCEQCIRDQAQSPELDLPPYEKWLEMLDLCEQGVFSNPNAIIISRKSTC